jgi:AAA domain
MAVARPQGSPDVAPLTAVLPPLALLWFATLHEVVRQQHLVQNLLLAGTLFVVYGESNSGKTFWLLDLCIAIAAGRPWRARPTQRGLVIYVAGEGATSVRMRVAAYRIANPDVDGGLPFAILPQVVDFLSFESVSRLIDCIRAAESECGEKVVLIVIDTFARAIPGGNENDAQDIGIAVAAADLIRSETGAAVGFIHHCGKDPAKGARGSSALRAATDTEILVEGLENPRKVAVTKQRDLEADKALPFELVPVRIAEASEEGPAVTSCVVKHLEAEAQPAPRVAVQLRGKSQRQLVAALRARAATDPTHTWTLMDLRQVGRELGMSKSTARSVVDAIAATTYLRPSVDGYRFTDGRVEG